MKDQEDERLEPVLKTVLSVKHASFKKKNGKMNVPSNDNDYFRDSIFGLARMD